MNIAEYLDQSGLTQVAFAQLIGVTQSTVAFWLHTKPPTIERCIQIEKATGGKVRCEDLRPDVDWAYLRGTASGEGCPPSSPPRPLPACGQGAVSTALQTGAPGSTAALRATGATAQAGAATTGAELGVA
jgi:DNA-binding XRE family transcriptional regulator